MLMRSLIFSFALLAAVLDPGGLDLLSRAGLGAQELTFRTETMEGLRPRNIGPAVMSGRIVDLAVVEKDTKVFYVASATGGLWKTTNNGVTFTPLFQDQPVHSIGDVAVHQTDTSIVWLGSGERANRQSSSWGDGVYKSTNGGRTWQNMGLQDSHHIGRVTLHPSDPAVVYVAALGHLWGPNEERGLFKSTNGGETWERILFVDENTGFVDVALDPENPQIVYAAAYQRRRRPFGFHGGGAGSALWKSVDGGETWIRLNDRAPGNGLPEGEVGRIGISIFRSDPRIVYVSVEQGLRYNASTAYEERRAGVYRSEDRGESWEFMSDWNPRPMYASQILVDPLDDQRIYMVNAFSWSDDGGRNFTAPRQTLHGDDRLVWVDPSDSRHVMKADDGGLGISYDRARTWLYVTHLPVSQFYRISYDYRDPYWVYGGLQDNGSWAGPSATYRSEGILNHDWVKWGGGDGFLSLVDITDNRTLYVESQYLGLDRVDLLTGQRQRIRPGDPQGAISPRKNWNTWGNLEAEEQRLGNAMAPANWDGPFALSPHDSNTIYAGTNILWKSTDQGRSWTSLGDRTTGVDRRTLRIMGQLPTAEVLSLDDGIPYFPSLTAIAESPLEEGVLYLGTDDGNVQVSRDGGETWAEVSDRLPGLPTDAWINGVEASRHRAGGVYVAANNYRNDDFANYLFRSDDFGESWEDISGTLPPQRVVRTVREDPRAAGVLYLGTEFGAFVSLDGGGSWVALAGIPTVAVNDLVVHPRDNDLILGTHGRGIWILDNVNALQELTAEVRESSLHLFSMEPARQIRYRSEKGHNGNMIFRGANPVPGAIIDFWLLGEGQEPTLTVLDDGGGEVARVPAPGSQGLNRAIWNLRTTEPGQGNNQPPSGPLVVPGTYTVRLSAVSQVSENTLEVQEDPRLEVSPQVRRQWSSDLLELADLARQAAAGRDRAQGVLGTAEEDPDLAEAWKAKAEDLVREWSELTSRTRGLRGEVEAWVGPLTQDQAAQRSFYLEMLGTLSHELDVLEVQIGGPGSGGEGP
ncbi:WD40/YVTN/BNR-like repeat-containing protein [Gemmatimonadota bacterium]